MSANGFTGKIKSFFSKHFNKDLLYVNTENGKTSVFALTFPIFFEFLATWIIGTIQSVMAANYENGFFVIPVNTVNVVFGFFGALGITASMGVTILLAAHLGKKDYGSAKKIIGNGVFLSVFISVVLAIPGIIFAEDVLGLVISGDEYGVYLSYAAELLKYRIIIFVAFNWYGVFTMALRCYGYSSVGFFCTLIVSVMTALLTFIALFVIKIPKDYFCVSLLIAMGVGSFSATLFAIFMFFKKKLKISLKPEWKWIKSLLRVGVPSSIFQFAYNISQILTTSICFALVADALLAKLYASQILGVVFQFGYAMGKANGIMVGRECGNGDFERAKKITSQNQKIVLFSNLTVTILTAALSVPLLRLLFKASDSVVAFALPLFFIDIAVELGRAFGHVGEGVLNATGDVVFMSSVSLLSCWGFSVGLTYLFVRVIPVGVIGVWIAFAVDELTRGICYYLRWKSGKWRKSFDKKVAKSENA